MRQTGVQNPLRPSQSQRRNAGEVRHPQVTTDVKRSLISRPM